MKKNWKETLKLWLGALLLLAESAITGCKKLPKKVMAVCLAAALVVAMVPVYVFAAETTYDIWVGGVQVTSANKDKIVEAINTAANATVATGTATYDPATNTLTLNNFSYTGLGYNHYYYYDEDYGEHYYSYAAIYSKNKLIIKLVGNNTVFCEGEGAGLPSFCGVYTEEYGDLTICDDTTDNAIGSFSANRISSYGNLTIRDVNVTAQYRLNALYSAGDLWIQNATVSAVADSNAITCSGNMTIENHSIVTATATDNGNDDDRGIYHLGTLTIKNSSLEIISGRKASGSFNENNLIPYLYFEGPYIVLAGEDKASAAAAASAEAATYTAKYVKIAPTYKITVNYGIDGVDNKETTVTMGDTISLENPVIDGYIFMGWYDDENFTTAFDFDTPITTATTIYAKLADYEGDKAALQDAIDALEADVAQLNKLTENGGTIDQINAKISAIESKVWELDTLKNKYAEADTALKQELQAADAAINAAIAALTNRVQDLEADLAAAKSDISTNTSKVAELTTNLATLNASLTDLSNKLTNDYATKAELTIAIDSAKATINNAIDALTTRVQDLEADLAAAKSDISTNTSKVAQLTAELAALNASLTDLSNKLTNDYATKAELTIAIDSAKATINNAIDALTTRVQDLEAGLADANSKIDTNTSDVGALKSDVAALNTWKTQAQDAITALRTLTETQGTDISSLKTAVQDLEAALAAANARIDDAEDRIAVLEGKVSALETAKQNLEAAVAALNAAIADKADTVVLNQKVGELNTAIAAAEAAAKTYADEKDTALQTQLTAAIAAAKGEAITAAENLVNTAKAELQNAIASKADTATVNAAIANLQNAITALENTKDNYIAADAALKAELEEKIATAKQEAIDAAKGHIPYIGTNGNWWIGDTDTGVDANGIKGDKGDKGDTGADGVGIAKIEKTATNGNVDTYTVTLTNGKTYTFTVTNGNDGANGKDGLTPFIGANGNWWLGEIDTGVKAVAEQTAQKGTDTITVVSIVVASVALLSNLALVIWIATKKKKVLV